MQMSTRLGANKRRSGFTLAEAAVTIAIVALTLTAVMESLERAKLKAAHTQLEKTAKELGMMTLGAIESGMWWDDIESGRSGSYADNEYPNFYWELALGEETFIEVEDNEQGSGFDNWAHNRELALEREYSSSSSNDDDEDEEAMEPYEQVRIRITFPKLREYENEVILERWVAWEQVYGEDEEEEGEGDGEGAGNAQGSTGGNNRGTGTPPGTGSTTERGK